MTARLYYHNPYVTSFEADVTSHVWIDDQPAVILDQTHFYPTSGGQPCDLGFINGVRVLEVSVGEPDDAVIHRLDKEFQGSRVQAEIDWPRRFDHMQQHTGQHIFSAAFEKVCDAETIGFHMGVEASTIDLAIEELSGVLADQVEELSNDTIYRNLPVRSTIVSQDAADKLSFRRPLKVTGPVRVVEIEDFDLAACGGTHVRNTGELGMVKIVKVERLRGGLRVAFLCGGRALHDYRFKNQLVSALATEFSVGAQDLEDAVYRLWEDAKALRHQVRKIGDQLLEYEAQDLLEAAENRGEWRIVSSVFADREREDVARLSRTLVSHPRVIALLGIHGPKPHLLFARSHDVEADMRAVLQSALEILGNAAGGGRAEIAQGGGPPADEVHLRKAVDHARHQLTAKTA